MKTICLYFQIHQPFKYRRYRFFDIGNDPYYYDDYANETMMRKAVENAYLPANKRILDAIKTSHNKFKVSFSISGIALEQFELYAPEVIESFKELNETGCVEFLSETYSHSLASLKNKTIFEQQINKHDDLIEKYFGHRPKVFRNTELIYSDEIGETIHNFGFIAMLTEGAKHVLGWKSPNYLYTNAINPRLKVLMRNYKLSDDISFRFSNSDWSEYPLTAEKYVHWINQIDQKDEIINLFMDYETFGERQKSSTGILDFLTELPNVALKNKLSFSTPSEIALNYQPISAVHVPNPISWADEERDLSAWIGNELQEEAFNKLYSLSDRVEKCTDSEILKDWEFLQTSDNFNYMSTKVFSDGEIYKHFNPFDSPYEAFINYMNVLSDFTLRLDKLVPEKEINPELLSLQNTIVEKEARIVELEAEKKELTTKRRTRTKKTDKTKKNTSIKKKGTKKPL